jgi:sugar lactone lactonase YvrE
LILLLLQGFASLAAPPKAFPKRIMLPNGFQPEGIATGRGTDFYVGSLGRLADDGVTTIGGAIYKGDLRTGQGQVLVPSEAGRMAIGLAVDRRTNYLFVAGGPFGNATVYDAATGATVAEYQLTTAPFLTNLINDVIVTRQAAYFTDSFRPFLYRVPLGPGGALLDPAMVQEIPLGGDFDHVPGQINANGIDATPNGKWLVVVNYHLGTLYRVEPDTGMAVQIDIGGDTLPYGDGILLDGKTLYVMQNEFNHIAVVDLAPDLLSGTVVRYITDPDYFKVPTTIAEFGSNLYAVNSRFDVAPPPLPGNPPADPNLEYDVIKVPKR